MVKLQAQHHFPNRQNLVATLHQFRMGVLGQGRLQAPLGAVQALALWAHLANQAQEQGHLEGSLQAALGRALKEGLGGVVQVQDLDSNHECTHCCKPMCRWTSAEFVRTCKKQHFAQECACTVASTSCCTLQLQREALHGEKFSHLQGCLRPVLQVHLLLEGKYLLPECQLEDQVECRYVQECYVSLDL